MKQFIYTLCVLALLCGCSQTKKPAPKEGRISVQTHTLKEIVKPSHEKVILEQPVSITHWPQISTNAQNKMPHAQISTVQKKVWTRNTGEGLSSNHLVLAHPVIANDVIYTLDSRLKVTAVKAQNGEKIWNTQLPVNKELGVASIGLAFDNNNLYAVSGDGNVYALDTNGKILWTKNTGSILRSAPVVANGLLFVISGNNELFALNTTDGSEVWNYKNIATSTNLMGMGQPAVSQKSVIVPFSSGEIIAFDTQNGLVLWSDTLLSYRTFNQISDLSHVLASPVIDKETVYLIGNANRMGAFNLKTGEPLFVQPIGGKTTPVVNGNTLFMVTNKDTLVALDKKKGTLIWEKKLISKAEKGIAWHAPLLANNQIIVTSTQGDILFLNSENGDIIRKMEIDALPVPPIVNNQQLIFYTNDADLIAYQ